MARKKKAPPEPVKYVSPRRQEAYVPTEVVCYQCELPSARGLPPFINPSRKAALGGLKGKIVRPMRHAVCPADADKIKELILAQRVFLAQRHAEWKKTQRTWRRH